VFPARALRTALRTLHLLAFGALYGGHLYGAPAESLSEALVATVGTGTALMLLDALREPVFLLQIRGLVTLVKVALAAILPLAGALSVAVLTLAAVLGAMSSHMPGRYRYYSIYHGRVVGSDEKG
jgi:hypothetical protein